MMTVKEMIEKANMEILIHADKLHKEAVALMRSVAYANLALENDDIKTAVIKTNETLVPIFDEKRIGSLTKNQLTLLDELDRVEGVLKNDEPQNT